ncbi:hypothetical protein B0H10DRAFT_2450101 [Mycena sp. CBHHK59/15]|nr:hypothetical protein B0H10DRAFT_2450101 [Mycena sp. CBHHK59/15]
MPAHKDKDRTLAPWSNASLPSAAPLGRSDPTKYPKYAKSEVTDFLADAGFPRITYAQIEQMFDASGVPHDQERPGLIQKFPGRRGPKGCCAARGMFFFDFYDCFRHEAVNTPAGYTVIIVAPKDLEGPIGSVEAAFGFAPDEGLETTLPVRHPPEDPPPQKGWGQAVRTRPPRPGYVASPAPGLALRTLRRRHAPYPLSVSDTHPHAPSASIQCRPASPTGMSTSAVA